MVLDINSRRSSSAYKSVKVRMGIDICKFDTLQYTLHLTKENKKTLIIHKVVTVTDVVGRYVAQKMGINSSNISFSSYPRLLYIRSYSSFSSHMLNSEIGVECFTPWAGGHKPSAPAHYTSPHSLGPPTVSSSPLDL